MSRLDHGVEEWTRLLARRAGRRSFLARMSRLFFAAGTLPLLPVARASAESASPEPGRPSENAPDLTADSASGQTARASAPRDPTEGPEGDPTSCDYWRHCAIDGFLCACCGGSATACPPGSEKSAVTWIGTCRNPADGKDYVISYNDCCGKGFCGRCGCNRNEGDRPEYHWYRSNDINWCVGTETQSYHCSVAVVVGQATEGQPER